MDDHDRVAALILDEMGALDPDKAVKGSDILDRYSFVWAWEVEEVKELA